MKIVGYSDRLSVQPEQSIRFMVSSELPAYRTEIVRLIHGDSNPKGPGVKHEPVETPVTGQYRGRPQKFSRGSFVIAPGSTAPNDSAFDLTRGFTVQALRSLLQRRDNNVLRLTDHVLRRFASDGPRS